MLTCVSLLLLVTNAVAQGGVRADGVDTRDKENRAEAPLRPEEMPLAELPAPPSLELGVPRPLALEAIDRLLAQIVDNDPSIRERASQSLLEAKIDWVPGIARRMDRLAERADKTALRGLLDTARDKARSRPRTDSEEKAASLDYLTVMLEHPATDTQTWRDLTQLLALSRMLTAISSAEAAREIIRIYVRFGEFMRIDCQRQLEALGDGSVAALIETQRHQAPTIGKWAQQQLSLLKKLDPHEAIRTDDQAALADILVALGRNGDPETTRLLISFAGTEKAQIRKAARQGIALLGEAAAWQLKDAYQDSTGRTPPRDWTWNRTARELFTEFDRLRLERVYRLFGQAKKAGEAGDLKKMREGFDQVLTLNPGFERSSEMVEGYLKYAESARQEDPDSALLALRRAERIDTDPNSRKKIQGQRLLLEAALLREKGLIDQALLARASSLDPATSDAAAALATPGEQITAWGARSRYLVASAVSLIALLGAAWIFVSGMRRRTHKVVLEPQQPVAKQEQSQRDQVDELLPAGETLNPNDDTRAKATDSAVTHAPNPETQTGQTETSVTESSVTNSVETQGPVTNSAASDGTDTDSPKTDSAKL